MDKKILIFILALLLLSGCNKESALVEPYKTTNQITETMKSVTEQGIYEIEVSRSKKQFIIYRGIQNGIQTMSYSIDNDILTVFFETKELNQAQDYVYKINSNSSFDTIVISIDGKIEAFKNIFVQ
jgi:PBP1b-binding outer membrane lipoprotein LpoB